MIIGICGRIGAGKSQVASIIKELYPEMNWQEKGFADKLRQVAELLTGIPAEEMKKQEVKEMALPDCWSTYASFGDNPIRRLDISKDGRSDYIDQYYNWLPMKLRELLQLLGTQAIRDGLHPQSWVNALFADYKPKGVRFESGREIRYPFVSNIDIPLDAKEFYPNWLICDTRFPNELEAITSRNGTCIRIVRPSNPYPQSNHASETSLDHIELLTIINDGNLDQLRIKVREVFDPIFSKCLTTTTSTQ